MRMCRILPIMLVLLLLVCALPVAAGTGQWTRHADGSYHAESGVSAGVTARGLDVSYYQKEIDWDKLYREEYLTGDLDFVILRCGYGSDYTSQDDAQWKRNADACTRLGIPFGVYLYSYANTEAKAHSEAAHALRLLKGYNPHLSRVLRSGGQNGQSRPGTSHQDRHHLLRHAQGGRL